MKVDDLGCSLGLIDTDNIVMNYMITFILKITLDSLDTLVEHTQIPCYKLIVKKRESSWRYNCKS
jgi:hypothetical protein